MAPQVLLVEDGPEHQIIVKATLKSLCDLKIVGTLAEARQELEKTRFDLVLVDVQLPDGEGFGFCANMRNDERFADLPFFFISGKNQVSDKVQAFQLGAEDYITKPFDPAELKARVSARLRRGQTQKTESARIQIGNLGIDHLTQRGFIHSEKANKPEHVDLSPIEYRLLRYFMKHQDHVLSRQQLLEAAWGSEIHTGDRTVDSHVSHLRRKIEASDYTIASVKGMGYALRPTLKRAA